MLGCMLRQPLRQSDGLRAECETLIPAGRSRGGGGNREDFAVSSPPIVLAAAAAQAQNIRLTSTVTVFSSADPVRCGGRPGPRADLGVQDESVGNPLTITEM